MMNVRRYAALLVTAGSLWGCSEQEEGDALDEPLDVAAQQRASGGGVDGGMASSALDAGLVPRGDARARDAAVQSDAASAADACATLTYESFGKAFMQKYCVGCHQGAAAPDGIDLSALRGVQADKREIDAHAVRTPRSKPMPPPGAPQPTAEERKKLGDWLRCGPN